jgi:hypothetical protein
MLTVLKVQAVLDTVILSVTPMFLTTVPIKLRGLKLSAQMPVAFLSACSLVRESLVLEI